MAKFQLLQRSLFFLLLLNQSKSSFDDPKKRNICSDNSAIAAGRWHDGIWVGADGCEMEIFDDVEPCFSSTRRIAFYGDSILRNVFEKIAQIIDKEFSFKMGRHRNHTLVKVSNTTTLEFFWMPSAFDSSSFVDMKDQIVVLGFAGSWDMGVSFQGINAYYHAVRKQLQEAKKFAKRIYWFNLPHVHPELCNCQASCLCECSSVERAKEFRAAAQSAISCESVSSNISMIDSLAITESADASFDAKDSLHYGGKVLLMQTQLVFNSVCLRSDGSQMTGQPIAERCFGDEYKRNLSPLSRGEELRCYIEPKKKSLRLRQIKKTKIPSDFHAIPTSPINSDFANLPVKYIGNKGEASKSELARAKDQWKMLVPYLSTDVKEFSTTKVTSLKALPEDEASLGTLLDKLSLNELMELYHTAKD
eukprot:g4057.t1